MKVKLFDKQFIHVMWDDVLLRKTCFYADSIDDLIKSVENNDIVFKDMLTKSDDDEFPFIAPGFEMGYRFAYYDPNYEFKRAYDAGRVIQYIDSRGYWRDCIPNWNTKDKYRVKPTKYYVGIDKQKKLICSIDPAAYKHVYESFDNTADASKWIDEHRKFVPVMRAFEKGLTIEYKHKGDHCWCTASTPSWDTQLRYRVKPRAKESCGDCSICKYSDILPLNSPCQGCYAIDPFDGNHDGFVHKNTKRRMTNRELAKWLADGNGQKIEGKNKFVYTTYAYKDGDSTPCRKDVLIRGWNETKWHEPEVEE